MKRNRTQQLERNEQARVSSIAKMDASEPIFRLQSGIYRIAGVASAGIAKKNAWIVEITLVSETYR